MADKEVRLIDANKLKETLKGLCSRSDRVTVRRIEDCMLHDIFPRIIDDEPTIEASPCDFCQYDGCGNPCIVCPATAKRE